MNAETLAKARVLLDQGHTKTSIGEALGVPRKTLADALRRDELGDSLQDCILDVDHLGDIDDLLRERGMDPKEWIVVSCVVNNWQALAGEGETTTLKQLKVTLKRRLSLILAEPAVHVPALAKPKARKQSASKPQTIVLEGDHHAPYNDPDLDRAMQALVQDLQPDEHIFGGDLGDYPTISRHVDHPAAMATPQECVDASYHLLRRRREDAPNARVRLLIGNHDHRLQSELLVRSERMYGLCPAGDELPALDIRRLLHLDTLNIELVEDPRGWEHADIELVPGRDGLVVRHGFITAQGTAKKTLDKAGRSVCYFHDHRRAHHCRLTYPAKVEHQAVGIAAMCRNDLIFPHYAQEPDWQFGGAVVMRWPNGAFQVEHSVWDGEALYWRNRRYI